MNSVFQGRSLLAEKDFYKSRIRVFGRLQYSLKKELKKKRDSTSLFRRKKISLFLFEKLRHGHALHLLQQRLI